MSMQHEATTRILRIALLLLEKRVNNLFRSLDFYLSLRSFWKSESLIQVFMKASLNIKYINNVEFAAPPPRRCHENIFTYFIIFYFALPF